ncbi:MAG: P-II family nitrogen regulator [Pseudomonadales bacterium]|jgi:nitrogen regulatory protein PII
MKPCKRLEIVIEQPLARRLAERLDELGAPGYTVLSNASGRGDRGLRRGDEVTDTFTNCVFIVACDDDTTVERIVEGVRSLITRSGGVCLVSDALWVRH